MVDLGDSGGGSWDFKLVLWGSGGSSWEFLVFWGGCRFFWVVLYSSGGGIR